MSAEINNRSWVIVHGALMLLAWGLLFPLGILLARHKWIFNCHKPSGSTLDVWFHLHRAVQCLGIVVFYLSFALASAYLDVDNLDESDSTFFGCGKAHQAVGTVVAGLVLVQLLLGFIRPKPGKGTKRKVWAMAHHWLGRLVTILAWTTVFLGIYIGHTSAPYNFEYNQWIIPFTVVIGSWIIVDIALSIVAPVSDKEGEDVQLDDIAGDAGRQL